MSTNLNSDLQYQPKIENSSFTDTKSKKRFKIKLFSLLLLITTLTLLLLGYFLALNYFRVISLSHISPIFSLLPISPYETSEILKDIKDENIDEISAIDTNTFAIEGSFDSFNENTIAIRTSKNKIVQFDLDPEVIIKKGINIQTTPLFTSDLLQKDNLGKKIRVEFIKKDNKNTIININID